MPKPVFDGEKTIIRLKPGDIIEDCRYHPCKVLAVTQDDLGDDDDIHMQSLVTGKSGHCSAQHCGIRLISADELAAWQATGIRDYQGLIDYWSVL